VSTHALRTGPRRYVVRMGAKRRAGLYFVRAVDVGQWVVTYSQRFALKTTSRYAADVIANGTPGARVVVLKPRPTHPIGEAKP